MPKYWDWKAPRPRYSVTDGIEYDLQQLEFEILAEQEWIKQHGGDLIGYIAQYGSVIDTQHYGEGGEAIYAADTAQLEKLIKKRNKLLADVLARKYG